MTKLILRLAPAALVLLTACTVHHPSAVALVDGVPYLEFKPCGSAPAVGWVKVSVLPADDAVIEDDAPAVWEAELQDGPARVSFPLVDQIPGYRVINGLSEGIQPNIIYAIQAEDPEGVYLGSFSFELSELREGMAFWHWAGEAHHDPIDEWRAKPASAFPNAC